MRSLYKKRPIATDGVRRFLYDCLYICPFVTFMSPAKTAEPIETPIGG